MSDSQARIVRLAGHWSVPALLVYSFLALLLEPGLLTGQMPWGEAISEYFPLRMEAGRLWAAGIVPWYTDRIFGGFPLLATSYTGVLYPPNLLWMMGDARVGLVLAAVHTVAGAFGMALYLRQWRVIPAIAVVGGGIFVCGAFPILHAAHVSMREGMLLAPWVAWGAARVLRTPSRGRVGVFALLVALQIASGYLQMVLMTGMWVAVEVIARWMGGARVRSVAWLAVGGALGVALMAIQLIPTSQMVRETPRTAMTFEHWSTHSLPPSHAVTWVFPRALGMPRPEWLPAREWRGAENPGELLTMVSPVVLFLALGGVLAARGRRRRQSLLFLGAAALMLLIALGSFTPVARVLFAVPPFSHFRVPARWGGMASVFLVVAGCLGLQAILRVSLARRILMASVGVVAAALAALVLARMSGLGVRPLFADAMVMLSFALALVGVGFALSIRRVAAIGTAGVLLVAGYEAVALQRAATPLAGEHRVVLGFDPHPLLTNYEQRSEERLYALFPSPTNNLDALLLPHATALFGGWRTLSGYSPLYHGALPLYLNMAQDGRLWVDDADLLANPAPLEALGVTHLLVSLTEAPDTPLSDRLRTLVEQGGRRLVAIEGARGRFDWAPRAVIESDPEVIRERVLTYPPGQRPVAVAPGPGVAPGDLTPLRTTVLAVRPGRTVLRVRADGPGMLVVRDLAWAGMSARIRPASGAGEASAWAPVEVVDGLVCGVPLGPGDHEVTIRYRPPGAVAGAVVSTLAGVLLLLVFVGFPGGLGRGWRGVVSNAGNKS